MVDSFDYGLWDDEGALEHGADDDGEGEGDVGAGREIASYGEAVHTPHIRGLVIAALGDLVEPFVAEVKRGQNRGEISNRLDATSVGRVLAALGIGFTILAAVDPQPSTASKQAIAMLLTGAFAEERKTP